MDNICYWCDSSEKLTEVYCGDDTEEEDRIFICIGCLNNRNNPDNVGLCRCCGISIAYYGCHLDHKGLCDKHKGEFDYSPEESQDIDDYIENITKDGPL